MRTKRGIAVVIESALLIVLLAALIVGLTAYLNNKKQWENAMKTADSKVVLYEGPKSLKDATAEDIANTSEKNRKLDLMHCVDTQITVNDMDCYVYDTNVNHTRQWVSSYYPPLSRTPIAYFDFEGTVKIQVTVPEREFTNVSISPLSMGIEPEVDLENKTITFYVSKPGTYTVMFDGAPERAVHIFANPLETDVPSPDDENVIFIGPGEWDIESIMMESGKTLYISGGAVVHGIINANYAHDIEVRGRGILDGSYYAGWQGREAYIPLKFDHCSDIRLRDIIVLNSNAWVCQGYDSADGVIDGLKIISARPNGDGITLQSCQNYQVRNCFVRSWDDSLVVKNYDRNSENITFDNMQLWTDLAQSMEVGYETNKGQKEDSYMRDISFTNITVLQNFHKPVISVHNADDALVENILFENIMVENEMVGSGDGDELPYLIDIAIVQNGNWSSTSERGQVRNVTIKDVTVLAGNDVGSRITGYDAEHTVENVTIENLNIFGKVITGAESGKFKINEESVSGVTFVK